MVADTLAVFPARDFLPQDIVRRSSVDWDVGKNAAGGDVVVRLRTQQKLHTKLTYTAALKPDRHIEASLHFFDQAVEAVPPNLIFLDAEWHTSSRLTLFIWGLVKAT